MENKAPMPAHVLARILGVTVRQADYLIKRKRIASRKAAARYEEITGVDRRAWCWPETFPNPLLDNNAASANPVQRPDQDKDA